MKFNCTLKKSNILNFTLFYQVQTLQNQIPGPSMLALISVISASFGKILIPSGGSLVRSAISRAICRIICGDRFSTFDVEHWAKA